MGSTKASVMTTYVKKYPHVFNRHSSWLSPTWSCPPRCPMEAPKAVPASRQNPNGKTKTASNLEKTINVLEKQTELITRCVTPRLLRHYAHVSNSDPRMHGNLKICYLVLLFPLLVVFIDSLFAAKNYDTNENLLDELRAELRSRGVKYFPLH